MRDSERFQRRAEQAADLARRADDPAVRRQLEAIARDWLLLADKAEAEERSQGTG